MQAQCPDENFMLKELDEDSFMTQLRLIRSWDVAHVTRFRRRLRS